MILPETTLTHSTFDYDVNILYIKKDHKDSIGMKIELEMRNDKDNTCKKVNLRELLHKSRQRIMTALKHGIPLYRKEKFELRGWTVECN